MYTYYVYVSKARIRMNIVVRFKLSIIELFKYLNKLSVIAVSCGSPRRVANATYINTGLTYGAAGQYTCMPGFWFQRDVTVMSVTCMSTGHWNDTEVDNCSRTS